MYTSNKEDSINTFICKFIHSLRNILCFDSFDRIERFLFKIISTNFIFSMRELTVFYKMFLRNSWINHPLKYFFKIPNKSQMKIRFSYFLLHMCPVYIYKCRYAVTL